MYCCIDAHHCLGGAYYSEVQRFGPVENLAELADGPITCDDVTEAEIRH